MRNLVEPNIQSTNAGDDTVRRRGRELLVKDACARRQAATCCGVPCGGSGCQQRRRPWPNAALCSLCVWAPCGEQTSSRCCGYLESVDCFDSYGSYSIDDFLLSTNHFISPYSHHASSVEDNIDFCCCPGASCLAHSAASVPLLPSDRIRHGAISSPRAGNAPLTASFIRCRGRTSGDTS